MTKHSVQTLDGLLEQGRQLPFREAVWIGIGIAEALRNLHEAGVNHGGLSPQDVVLAPDGRVQLTYRRVPPVRRSDAFNGDPHGGERADLDAAGVLLYRMVTGNDPSAGAEEPSPGWQQDAAEPVDRLVVLCRRMTSRNRLERPPSAAALTLELRSIWHQAQGQDADRINQRAQQVWGRSSQPGSPPWRAQRSTPEGHGLARRVVAATRSTVARTTRAASRARANWRRVHRRGVSEGAALFLSAIARWRIDPLTWRRALRLAAILLVVTLPVAAGWLLGGLGAGRYVSESLAGGPAASPAAGTPSHLPSPGSAVSVPHLSGLTVPQAWSRLIGRGLALAAVIPVAGDPGLVTKSEPRGGTLVRAGAKVTLFVGAVPDRRLGGPDITHG